jgi:hypothetical protein
MKATKIFPRQFKLRDGRGKPLYQVSADSETVLQEKIQSAMTINPQRGNITAHADGFYYTLTEKGLKLKIK